MTGNLIADYKTEEINHLGLVAGMYDELEIGTIIDKAIPQDFEKRNVSIGQAVKAMVINGLGFVNQRLYLMPEFFENKPVDRLIGKEIEAEHLNDDVLGRALDDIYACGPTELYSLIGIHSCRKLGLDGPRFGHLDGTSFHLHGQYNSEEEPEEGVIHITRGYSRDHRPDLNQVILDLIVENKARIPILMKPLSGNGSDKTDFREIIAGHINQLEQDHGIEYLVSDSALYTQDTLHEFAGSGIHWISRVPETINDAVEAICQTKTDEMEELCQGYKGRILTSNYAGIEQRWLVVHSEAARKRAVKAVNRDMLKKSERETSALKKLCRKEFACEADARKALEDFQSGLKYTALEETTICERKKYGRKGRPGKNEKPENSVFLIEAGISTSLEQRKSLVHRKSCFVLGTDEMDEQKLPPAKILEEYKGQSRVEGGFRFLKDPLFFASSFFLKSPKRIMAMLMVMTICLLVYAALEYRLRNSLQEKNKTFPDQKGKQTQKPTARWVFQCFVGIHLLTINKEEKLVLNMKDRHKIILECLGDTYQKFYS